MSGYDMRHTQERGAGGDIPRIRQLLPAQPEWFAIHAKVPGYGEADGFEMLPVIGWALLDEEARMGGKYDPQVAALVVWSALDTIASGSAPDARPHLVVGERSGFLGFAFPGCSVDWERMAEEYRRVYWDEEQADWEE